MNKGWGVGDFKSDPQTGDKVRWLKRRGKT